MISKLSFWNKPRTVQSTAPKYLPLDVPIEEETIPHYDAKLFYHPNPGDILNGKFELIAKVGWGTESTVWLAQDVRWRLGSKPYVAIKINACADSTGTASRHELEISDLINSVKSEDWGRRFVRTAKESFEVRGPHGSHLCLVLEPMREPIWLLRRRLGAEHATRKFLPFFKLHILAMLGGLEHLHAKCHIVHTDLKLDNILVTFEDRSVIDDFVRGQIREPMPRKVLKDRVVYLSHSDFGAFRRTNNKPALLKIHPVITDFGLAQRRGEEILIHPIQVEHCHAPEVLLGCGWSYSADIWNFGVMIWDLLAGSELFQRIQGEDGAYSARHHLAEMIALLGPVPPKLVKRERDMRCWKWAPEVDNAQGKVCDNAADYFGGPFFDDGGHFVGSNLIPADRVLKDIVPECISPEEDLEPFLAFMRKMLCWLPEDRATAEELQTDPWLLDLPKEGRQ